MLIRTFACAALVAVASFGPVVAQEAKQEGLKIFFDTGKSTIRSDQQGVLDQAAGLFRDGNPVVMIVSGSADTVGSPAKNLDLSIRRARSVADGLVDRGIPIERLQVLGAGNSELIVPTGKDEPNVENRSVTINWR